MDTSYHQNAFRARHPIKSTKQIYRDVASVYNIQAPTAHPSVKIGPVESKNKGAPSLAGSLYGFCQRQYEHNGKECFVKYKNLFEPRSDIKLDALPSRIPMSCNKRIHGRFFQRHIEIPENDSRAPALRRLPTAPIRPSSSTAIRPMYMPLDTIPERECASAKLPYRPKRISSPEPRATLYDFSTLDSEIFSISFKNGDKSEKSYDPDSEIHSDYYSIRRLPVRGKRAAVANKKPSDVSMSLQGCSKKIHCRIDNSCIITPYSQNSST